MPSCRSTPEERRLGLQTHYSMRGGNFTVPADRIDTMYDKMVSDWQQGPRSCVNFMVERRREKFPMLYDFDIFVEPGSDLSLETFLELFSVVQCDVMRPIYPEKSAYELRGIVSTAPTLLKDHDVTVNGKTERRTLTKRGYHVVHPEIIVTKSTAFHIRHCVIKTLSARYGDRFVSFIDSETEERVHVDTWRDFVDKSVITANGLRMLTAHKASFCPKSKHLKSLVNGLCDHCYRCTIKPGFVDGRRPYKVVAVIDGDGKHNSERMSAEFTRMTVYDPKAAEQPTGLKYALQQNRILLLDHEELAEDLPDFVAGKFEFTDEERDLIDTEMGLRKMRNNKRKLMTTAHLPGTVRFGERDNRFIEPGTEAFKELESVLKSCYKRPWRDTKDGVAQGKNLWDECGGALSSVCYEMNNKMPRLQMFPVTMFCVNVEREHSSNRCFFTLEYKKSTKYWHLRPGCFSTSNSSIPCNSENGRVVFGMFELKLPEGALDKTLQQLKVQSLDTGPTSEVLMEFNPGTLDFQRKMMGNAKPPREYIREKLFGPNDEDEEMSDREREFRDQLVTQRVKQPHPPKALSDRRCVKCHKVLKQVDEKWKSSNECSCGYEHKEFEYTSFKCARCNKLYKLNSKYNKCTCVGGKYRPVYSNQTALELLLKSK